MDQMVPLGVAVCIAEGEVWRSVGVAGSGVVVGSVIFLVGVALFVDFGKVINKAMPLIIPRIYMSRASLREGAFERVGVGFGVMV